MAKNNHILDLRANGPEGTAHNVQDNYWICVLVPYDRPDTFDRRRLSKYVKGELDVSLQDALPNPAESSRIIMFGDTDIINWSTTYSKSSYSNSFNASLVNNGGINYLQDVVPGDYIFFWAFEDRDTYEKVRNTLANNYKITPERDTTSFKNGKQIALNAWNSGLKFMGTVESVRQFEQMAADGRPNVGYQLSANGCTEFGNHIYYDDQVKFAHRNIISFMGTLGLSAQDFLTKKGYVNSSVALPFIAYLWLGRGPTDVNVDPSGISVRGSPGIKDTPNRSLEVPKTVLKFLGADGPGSKGVFSDLIQFFIGIQSYSQVGNDEWNKMLPDLKAADSGFNGLYLSGTPLDDNFSPQPLDLKNVSVWALMGSYLNPPMNEMYVAWKPNPTTGNLFPTIVVRRLPLVSDDYINAVDQSVYPTTPFSKLPRWIVNPDIVKSVDIGRNNASRVNAVYINGHTKIANSAATNDMFNRVTAPPAYNGADIYRYGLRPYFVTVPAFIESALEPSKENPGRYFTALMTDVLMDQHLRYSGSIFMVGRQAPVQPGDNVVFNNILFHIEQLQHNGGISADGKKTFDTTMWVSNGIPLVALDPRTKEENKADADRAIGQIEEFEGFNTEKYEQDIQALQSEADMDGYRLLQMRNARADLKDSPSTISATTSFTKDQE